MKNSLQLLAVLSILIIPVKNSYAQTVLKEGTITYNITADMPDHPEVASMFASSTSVIHFKPGHMLQEMNMGMSQTRTLFDATKDSGISLIDAMGNKMMVRMNGEQLKQKQVDVKDYDVKLTDETKQIAGYTCKKAVITTKEGDQFDYWYTTSIVTPTNDWKMFSKIDGFPLEYQFSRQGVTMTFTAASVNTDPVKDDVFVVSTDGYKEVPFDELLKMMGKKQ